MAGPATDIYALGCVLWVALTGTQPYPRPADHLVIAAHESEPVPQAARRERDGAGDEPDPAHRDGQGPR
ncbi:hypothetical protein [Nocardioides convexus]|uniref:hypothetical protein n=1 Tax=Nocardioides convexus TaxID=2712224 RepID=UPI002418A38F|nr:hypothetical protein [Nocardioides convexus]